MNTQTIAYITAVSIAVGLLRMSLALPPPFIGGWFWVPYLLSLAGYALSATDNESFRKPGEYWAFVQGGAMFIILALVLRGLDCLIFSCGSPESVDVTVNLINVAAVYLGAHGARLAAGDTPEAS